ncbi:protein SDA1 homolog [Amphibalanus amphitrite]|uniref:protein SDA1 homolog n=1 Tax=Amphibalanus amphitrite TaxID=1232801 RepID=UPI001C91C052|nr:protein SDA1 homolog [Amphibalanus amphitrite]
MNRTARVGNQLPNNLPQLQNLIKRDHESYQEEFNQQWRHYQSTMQVFRLQPDQYNQNLDELTMFVAQVAHCYPETLALYPQELMDMLRQYSTVIDTDMRMTFVKALILLRNKNLLTPTALLELFFELLRCQDKALRDFLQSHIVSDIKNVNAKRKNMKLNSTLQNFMYSMLKDSHAKAAKIALDVMIDLYKKGVWNDQKTVNVITTALFSKTTKVMVTALKFFLGKDEDEEDSSDSESEDDTTAAKAVITSSNFTKKTRKKKRALEKAKALANKSKKKKKKSESFNFSALHLVNDAQGLAERLYKKLETLNERYEVKLMMMSLISRLVGIHELFLFNFYPLLQRFLQPHQRDVTRILQYAAQASHVLVPPDVIQPMLMTIANNFVTERNSSEVITVGINAIREVCVRCPLAMGEDLLQDLAQYKKYRDKNVMMAARSLIQHYRTTHPELLHRKDRGRPTEATGELDRPAYGAVSARDYIPGAEVLDPENPTEDDGRGDEDDSDGWVNVSDGEIDDEEGDGEDAELEEGAEDSEDEEGEAEEGAEGEESGEEVEDEEGEEEDDEGEESDEDEKVEEKAKTNVKTPQRSRKSSVSSKVSRSSQKSGSALSTLSKEEKMARASAVVSSRLLTDSDFRRIERAQLAKQMDPLKKGGKRKADEMIEEEEERGEIVTLKNIERIHKKPKADKETRLLTAKAGKPDREQLKFGRPKGRVNPNASTTNKEKKKTKNFMMLRHKLKNKTKKSFSEKQRSLRDSLLKRKKKSKY